MRMLRKPPSLGSLFESVPADRISKLLNAKIDEAARGKYLHWEDLRVRTPPEGLSAREWWLATKLKRAVVRQELPFMDKHGSPFWYSESGDLYRRLRAVDRDASGQIGVPFGDGFHAGSGQRYLMSSLIEEAITSSQLEGAATTRRDAKEMLRSGRAPRDNGERMIVNNHRAMDFLRRQGRDPLTVEMLLELQRTLTQGTLDANDVGRFRRPSDVVDVAQWDGTVVHTPPPATETETRIERLLAFANTDDDGHLVHPFVRAVVLHFMIGYDHPFVDGNGRTARALFYWSMARSGYWLTEYLSISTIIHKAPAQYVRAYVYSETDENDLTYFLDYNLRVMVQAIQALHLYLARKSREMDALSKAIRGSDSAAVLNHRQIALLGHILRHPDNTYTIAGHQHSHSVSYPTARADLMGLADLEFLDARRQGRKLVYRRSGEFEDNVRGLQDFAKEYNRETVRLAQQTLGF